MTNNKTRKLPNNLTIALGQYFLSYANCNSHKIGETHSSLGTSIHYSPDQPWNKQECLDRIDAAIIPEWSYQSSAGSFWLFKRGNKKTHYYIDKQTWPLAEIRSNKRP